MQQVDQRNHITRRTIVGDNVFRGIRDIELRATSMEAGREREKSHLIIVIN